ncbi:MAG: hypothetical protein EVA89_11045 [Sandaracinaceae bacterium]|nr:MAG: hypothetical protein EVA89_11045 [Sandaracinaceae bacterium]
MRRGVPFGVASAGVAVGAGATWTVGQGTPLAELGAGAFLGAGGAAITGAVSPNWRLGMRPRLFVSHSFADSDEYLQLTESLRDEGLDFFDHSVPVDQQFRTSSARVLQQRLQGQIRGTSALVYLAGPGVELRPCVRDEVSMAIDAEKPIIVVDSKPDLSSRLPANLSGYELKSRIALDEPGKLVGALAQLRSE